jgi:hypothetical protein
MLVLQFTSAYNALRFGGQADAAPQLSALLDDLEKRREAGQARGLRRPLRPPQVDV